ncbi:fluoride efflux transporter FluC [Actinopolyspora mortivallis]|uniref:Fluoride-specific ion channel FluC n=1 Tax=Actinopolyspora mortivallis TaxID=33906 RepID=A0A2T0GUK9_ACTMO|nr:CrcB family protein [Actinopolyspora mortivallis]PRW62805.1 CrcB family protein [Actinopolyspora mortivallis]
MTSLLVAVGGACGAVSRYGLDGVVRRWCASPFPWGTLVVNLLGSFLVAVVTGWAAFGGLGPAWLRPLLVSGLCGALTTFATFGQDTVRLYTSVGWGAAVRNVVVTVFGGVVAAAFGLGVVFLLRT